MGFFFLSSVNIILSYEKWAALNACNAIRHILVFCLFFIEDTVACLIIKVALRAVLL